MPENCDIQFTDLTVIQGKGYYEKIKAILAREVFGGSNWMLESRVTVDSQYGTAQFVLHFFDGGQLVIDYYVPSVKDAFYCEDISFLSEWSQEHGWGLPRPSRDMVKDSPDFWRYYWESNLIESDDLLARYGDKRIIDTGEDEDIIEDLPQEEM